MGLYTETMDNFLNVNTLSNNQISSINVDSKIADGSITTQKISNLSVDTITVTPTGFIRSGKTSFTDTALGWYQSAEGIYFGSAADATKFKFTMSNGHIDLVWWTIDATSTIDGRTASILADAIDAAGHFADDAINTATSTIVTPFTFDTLGAIQIGTYVNTSSGDVKISPAWILARDKTGATSFFLNGATGVISGNGLVVGTNVGLGIARQNFVTTPTTPYYVWDLWSGGTTGDLKKCITQRLTGSYNAADWWLASKYTDDSGVTTIVWNTVTTAYVNALDVTAAHVDASISITSPVISGGSISIGTWDNIFKADSNGIYLGNATFADAPFQVDMAGNVKVSSLARDDYHIFTIFESVDAYKKTYSGEFSICTVDELGISLTTGHYNTNKVTVMKRLGSSMWLSWDKKTNIKFSLNTIADSNNHTLICYGDISTNVKRHIGWYQHDGTLYGTCGNNTNESTVNLGATSTGLLEFKYLPGDSIKYYLNWTYIDQITTNLPSGEISADIIIDFSIENTDATDTDIANLYIGWWDYWQAN